MLPGSKCRTLKRVASIHCMLLVKKQLQKLANLRIEADKLFTYDESSVSKSGEKVISFMLDSENSFHIPTR